MKSFDTVRGGLRWTAAALLGVLPIALAADFAGVLWWTQYVAALAVLAILLIAAAGVVGRPAQGGFRRHLLLIPLLLWAAFAWAQTLTAPQGLVGLLSPASETAYTQWVAPLIESSERPRSFPVSLAPFQSRHAAAILTVVCGFVWAVGAVFTTRAKTVWLLASVALAGALCALSGIIALVEPALIPGASAAEAGGSPFGTFVNRNNAALMMNLGLAASLGLLAWRLTALTGTELDEEAFEFNDLISLVSDRDSMIGTISAVLCIGGLLACGSRGGIAAAVVGLTLALGWVRRRRGLVSLPVVATVIALCAAILLVPTDFGMRSIDDMELMSAEATATLLEDGRWDHWPDGWAAAKAHLPAGSGLGTYAYAYLPHAENAAPKWFEHADNLWLELVTEQGIIGVLLAIAVMVLIVRSLGRLVYSPDPIDQGLRTAGWFALGAIVVSQAFDFGLILPANLFLTALLLTAIVARDAAAVPSVISDDDDAHLLAYQSQAEQHAAELAENSEHQPSSSPLSPGVAEERDRQRGHLESSPDASAVELAEGSEHQPSSSPLSPGFAGERDRERGRAARLRHFLAGRVSHAEYSPLASPSASSRCCPRSAGTPGPRA